jgi:hypothetical protein
VGIGQKSHPLKEQAIGRRCSALRASWERSQEQLRPLMIVSAGLDHNAQYSEISKAFFYSNYLLSELSSPCTGTPAQYVGYGITGTF